MKKRGFAVLLALLLLLCGAASAEIWRFGDETVPKIAITVDDCYKKQHMAAILDLCEQYGVPVTFFPVGLTIYEEDRELWQRAVDLGCEIGNHTYSHTCLLEKVNYQQVRSQFIRMENALDTALGYHYEVQLYRPPYGEAGKSNQYWSRYDKCGYFNVIKWSVSQTNFEKCIKQVKNGSILLFHTNAKDVKCIEQLIPAVLEKGLTPVTVSELLNLEPVVKERTESELVFPPVSTSPTAQPASTSTPAETTEPSRPASRNRPKPPRSER